MHISPSFAPSFALRPVPLGPGEVSLLLAARDEPIARHQLTRAQLRQAEELVRLGHLSKTAEERKRRDRMFRLTRQGHAWLYDHGLGNALAIGEAMRHP